MKFNIKPFTQLICGVAFFILPASIHAQLKVMTIGDSLTEEYYFEFPFSAPSLTPIIGFANTKNWVEILAEQRPSDLNFGSYENQWPFGYTDFRQAGYEYNFGIPGTDTLFWVDLLDPISNPFDPDFDEDFDLPALLTRTVMRDTYVDMDVVVIMLGGNDVNFQYGDLYDALPGDTFATNFIAQVVDNLEEMVDEVRDYTTVPIVLANVPDLGASPDIIVDHPNAALRANASAIINDLNVAVAAMAANRGLTLAPLSDLTDQLLSTDPIYIGAHEMIKSTDPTENNGPLYLFCWQGLHPSTNGQAMMANILLMAINSATASNIALLESREILTDLLSIDPDQPYLDWVATNNLTNNAMTADADGDGMPNLGEFLLGLDPLTVNADHVAEIKTISNTDYLTLGYTPDADALRLANGVIKYSTTLTNWQDLPNEWFVDLNNGSFEARLPIGSLPNNANHAFLRMEFNLRP
ncbi:MAG: SGNH/GDSL hydrolase family protein [Akkermansiaceae bacterium]